MTIPVIWLNLDRDSIVRGFWDQGLLERILGGDIHRLRYEYEHHEVRRASDWPNVAYGIVVLPGRFHASMWEEIDILLRRLEWVLLIVTSDEESLFPIEAIRHPRLLIWVQTPHPTRNYDPSVRFFPDGCKQDTTEILSTVRHEMGDRDVDVFLSAQLTHVRREQAFDALRYLDHERLHVISQPTRGFTESPYGRDSYLRTLARTRFAPCPAGPVTPDTLRWAEALEAMCIPLTDGHSPDGPSGYWHRLVRGEPEFPVIEDWGTLGTVIEVIDQVGWMSTANRIQAWWQRYKRNLVWLLEYDIDELRGESTPPTLADLVTVIVPTSPILSHPSTAVIEETVASIRERLPDAEIVIAFDGVRPEQETMRAAYDEYVRRVLTLAAFEWRNVVPVVLDEWGHQANATRAALAETRTPLILFVEHDCPLMGDIPFDDLAGLVLAGEANVIRFAHEVSILEPHLPLMLDDEPRWVHGVPLTATVQWSQRPHLALTAFYRTMLRRYFGVESRTMIEDVMHGVVQRAHVDGGWGMFRLFIYTPPGDIKRSTTSDGRGTEPKYEMTIEYDGDQPEWAPRPTSELVAAVKEQPGTEDET